MQVNCRLLNAIKINHSTFTIKNHSNNEKCVAVFCFLLSLYQPYKMGSLDSLEAVSKSILFRYCILFMCKVVISAIKRIRIICFSKIHFMKCSMGFFFFIKFSAALQSSRFHYDYFPFRNAFGPSARTERVSLDLWKLG